MVGRKLSSREQHLHQSVSLHQLNCSVLVTQWHAVDKEEETEPHAIPETAQEPVFIFIRAALKSEQLNTFNIAENKQ